MIARKGWKILGEKKEQYFLLKLIAKSDAPVGCGTACKALNEAEYKVSEATVGRLLRLLDQQGLTQREGFKGRILTKLGQERLEQIVNDETRMHHSQKLANLVGSRNKEELLEILVARKAIEREIARQAALNITPQQLSLIESIAKPGLASSTKSVVQKDVEFHYLLAEAAGNKVLKAALDLIRQDAQLSPVLEYIRKQVHSQVLQDHFKIFAALKARDPEASEKAMVEHVDNLISDVQKFWSLVHKEETRT